MIVLVDYSNIDSEERRLGALHVIRRFVEELGAALHAEAVEGRAGAEGEEQTVRCRLYGGWFEGATATGWANHLARDLEGVFPRRLDSSTEEGTPYPVLVHAELARSLAEDDVDLTHTYRRRPFPENLTCDTTPPSECYVPNGCPIGGVQRFINRGKCPIPGCEVVPEDVLARGEQKLVDSMMIVDLMRYAYNTEESLVVVSGDEDLWPGIRGALHFGARVIQMIPQNREYDARRYRDLETVNFSRIVL